RDFHVTGVQTCALPIYIGHVGACGHRSKFARLGIQHPDVVTTVDQWNAAEVEQASTGRFAGQREGLRLAGGEMNPLQIGETALRSEERRVGKEGRSRCE